MIGHESQTYDGINTTFNEQADRNELADNNLYENCYAYILRENIVICRDDWDSFETSYDFKKHPLI